MIFRMTTILLAFIVVLIFGQIHTVVSVRFERLRNFQPVPFIDTSVDFTISQQPALPTSKSNTQPASELIVPRISKSSTPSVIGSIVPVVDYPARLPGSGSTVPPVRNSKTPSDNKSTVLSASNSFGAQTNPKYSL